MGNTSVNLIFLFPIEKDTSTKLYSDYSLIKITTNFDRESRQSPNSDSFSKRPAASGWV